MSIRLGRKAAGAALAAVAAAALIAPAAQATPITYDFTVSHLTGALAGNTYHGTFSFDSSLVQPNQWVISPGLLSSLDFPFAGVDHTTANTNTGFLEFNGQGGLVGFQFGSNCDGASCAIGPTTWIVDVPGYAPGFQFSDNTFVGNYTGQVNFSLAASVAAVPEPGALGVFGLGLALLGMGALLKRRGSPRQAC